MKLFDNVGESVLRIWTKLDKKCPVCGYSLDIVPELMSKRFGKIECQQCHLSLEISTRNNYRISMAILFLISFAFIWGLLLKILF